MRKFLFSGAVISALFSGIGVANATRQGPRDWRLVLMWISWGLSVAIAVGTVVQENNDSLDELES